MTSASSPIANLDQLVKDYAQALQALNWQRMIRANLATELLQQRQANQILRGVLGCVLQALGGTYTITVEAMQTFDMARVEPLMVAEPQTQNWILSLVERKA